MYFRSRNVNQSEWKLLYNTLRPKLWSGVCRSLSTWEWRLRELVKCGAILDIPPADIRRSRSRSQSNLKTGRIVVDAYQVIRPCLTRFSCSSSGERHHWFLRFSGPLFTEYPWNKLVITGIKVDNIPGFGHCERSCLVDQKYVRSNKEMMESGRESFFICARCNKSFELGMWSHFR